MNNTTRVPRSRARIRCMHCCLPITVDVHDDAPPECGPCSINPSGGYVRMLTGGKATVVLPPVDDDRVLSRVGGAIDAAVPSKGTRANTNRPKGTSQVVYDARLGYRRPSIG